MSRRKNGKHNGDSTEKRSRKDAKAQSFQSKNLRESAGCFVLSRLSRQPQNSLEPEKIEISLPKSVDEQRAIAAILSDMDAEIAALETRRAKTHALKQGMMQELLTGRTRLVDS